jgi:tetratricopeptide (TPR) repeat protein
MPTPADAGSSAATDSARRPHARSHPSRLTRAITFGLAAISATAIGFAGYGLGERSAASASPATPVASAPATAQGQIVWVTEQLQANPTDIALLQHQGDLYYQMGDYGFAAASMEKIIAIDPTNVKARLALAAGMFNLGRMAEAEGQWRRVLEVDPDNLEAHYDLGFMYLNQVPPDLAKVKAEWGQVLRIAPDSDVALSISEQMQRLGAPLDAGSPPSSSAAPASPAPSPASSR